MGKLKYIILLLLIVFSYLVYTAKSPATFEISGTSCIISTCLVGQKATFDLTITPHGKNTVTNFWIESAAIDQGTLKIIPRQNSPAQAVSFALKDTLEATNYTLDINAEIDTAGFKGFFWMIKNKWFGDDIFYSQEFRVRYPRVELKLTPISKGNLEAQYRFVLHNKDSKAFTCRLQLKTDADLFTEYSQLKLIRDTPDGKVYESPATSIGVNQNGGCCEGVLVRATTEEGTSNLEVITRCTVDGAEVILRDEIKTDNWEHRKN